MCANFTRVVSVNLREHLFLFYIYKNIYILARILRKFVFSIYSFYFSVEVNSKDFIRSKKQVDEQTQHPKYI